MFEIYSFSVMETGLCDHYSLSAVVVTKIQGSLLISTTAYMELILGLNSPVIENVLLNLMSFPKYGRLIFSCAPAPEFQLRILV